MYSCGRSKYKLQPQIFIIVFLFQVWYRFPIVSEQVRQIASRIRELREIEGVPLETLAQEFNICAENYRDFESGVVDIPRGRPFHFR